MIEYPHGRWGPLTFAFRGTVLPRVLPKLLLFVALAAGVDLVGRLGYISFKVDPLAHSLVGVALGMLLVFRTNASYERYWDGRKRWGSIITHSRNLVRASRSFVGSADGLWQLVAAYPVALKHWLRNEQGAGGVETWLPEGVGKSVRQSSSPPLKLAALMSDWIAEQVRAARLLPHLAADLEAHVAGLVVDQGACERIVKTPIPFAYASQIRQLLVVYLATLPFVLVSRLGWVAAPSMAFIAFALLGIEEAGIEIEQPFDSDANDLPLESFCAVIATDAKRLATA